MTASRSTTSPGRSPIDLVDPAVQPGGGARVVRLNEMTQSLIVPNVVPEPGSLELPGSTAAVVEAVPRLEAVDISAWFGSTRCWTGSPWRCRLATVTALIGPSGCGKSTFLRILNRMHESVPGRQAGRRGAPRRRGHLRARQPHDRTPRQIGMVFQKPNPFPAMSIADNVTAGLTLTGTKVSRSPSGTSWWRRCLHAGRSVERGQGPARAAGRGAVGWPAAAAVHRPVAGRRPEGAADGRAVLGARPDLDPPDRGDDRRAARRGDHRHRHPQHAAGRAGLPAGARSSWPSRARPAASWSSGPTEELFERPARPADRRLRPRSVRMTATTAPAAASRPGASTPAAVPARAVRPHLPRRARSDRHASCWS